MADFIPAIQDESRTETGQIVGDCAKTVFFNGKPVVLEGSISSSGATVLKPPLNRNIEVEGRVVAAPGDILSDGSIILPNKDNQSS